jgi:hypothetical protein
MIERARKFKRTKRSKKDPNELFHLRMSPKDKIKFLSSVLKILFLKLETLAIVLKHR